MGLLHDFFAHLGTTQFHRVALGLLVVSLGIGMGVGFSVAATNAKDAADNDYNERFAIFSEWQVKLTSRFSQAESLAATIAAYAMGYVNESVSVEIPPAQRRRTLGIPGSYERLCRGLFRDVPGITSMSLAPGGVLSQGVTIRTINFGYDLYNTTTYKASFDKMRHDGLPTVTGPSPLASRPNAISVNMWYPIFANDTVGPDTFWGVAVVNMEVKDILKGLNIVELEAMGMDFVMWYNTLADGATRIVGSSTDIPSNETVMRNGMRMQLPVGEAGKESFLAIHPRNGVVSEAISSKTAISIVVGTVLGALGVTLLWYCVLLGVFMYRHRAAPYVFGNAPMIQMGSAADSSASGANDYTAVAGGGNFTPRATLTTAPVFIAAITLRGAQPIADRAPLEAVRIFTEFGATVRDLATAHGCYPVSEIGDRCVYVVSACPHKLSALARHVVTDVAIVAGRPAHNGRGGGGAHTNTVYNDNHSRPNTGRSASSNHYSGHNNNTNSHHRRCSRANTTTNRSVSHSRTTTNNNNTTTAASTPTYKDTDVTITSQISESSFMATVTCRPSVAFFTANSNACVYDPSRDRYFYGTASALSKLCAVIDVTRPGEVAWTEKFSDACALLASHHSKKNHSGAGARNSTSSSTDSSSASLATHSVDACRHLAGTAMAMNAVDVDGTTIHVASWWRETGDERDNEDPSTAMALLTDAYVNGMMVLVSSVKVNSGGGGRGGGGRSELLGGAFGGGSKGEKSGGGGSSSKEGGANKSSTSESAVSVTRNASLLHIAVADGLRDALDLIRKIVREEKGTVVSAHASRIVAAFNLLSPCSQHQLRAATTVERLRDALKTRFVCSLHHGKVNALISDGLIMCTGDATGTGLNLLDRALVLAPLGTCPMVVGLESFCNNNYQSGNGPTTTSNGHSSSLAVPPMLMGAVNTTTAGTSATTTNNNASSQQQYTAPAPLIPIGPTVVRRSTSLIGNNRSSAPSGLTSPTSSPSATVEGGHNGAKSYDATVDNTINNNAADDNLLIGFCTLYSASEMATIGYECEAVDVVYNLTSSGSTTTNNPNNTNGKKSITSNPTTPETTPNWFNAPAEMVGMIVTKTTTAIPTTATTAPSSNIPTNGGRVVYRLGEQRRDGNVNKNAAAADEWMYQLKDEEDTSAYATVNAIFARIASGEHDEARRLWQAETAAAAQMNGSSTTGGAPMLLLAGKSGGSEPTLVVNFSDNTTNNNTNNNYGVGILSDNGFLSAVDPLARSASVALLKISRIARGRLEAMLSWLQPRQMTMAAATTTPQLTPTRRV